MISCSDTGSGRWVIMCLSSKSSSKSCSPNLLLMLGNLDFENRHLLEVCQGEEFFIDFVFLCSEPHLNYATCMDVNFDTIANCQLRNVSAHRVGLRPAQVLQDKCLKLEDRVERQRMKRRFQTDGCFGFGEKGKAMNNSF